MNQNIAVMNPFLLSEWDGIAPKCLRLVHCKGGGGDSSAEYENQLREQRLAREKAEKEAADLKSNQEATAADRKKRGQASYLTGGGGTGDEEMTTKKSHLGSGS